MARSRHRTAFLIQVHRSLISWDHFAYELRDGLIAPFVTSGILIYCKLDFHVVFNHVHGATASSCCVPPHPSTKCHVLLRVGTSLSSTES